MDEQESDPRQGWPRARGTCRHLDRILGGALLATTPRVDWARLLRRTVGLDVGCWRSGCWCSRSAPRSRSLCCGPVAEASRGATSRRASGAQLRGAGRMGITERERAAGKKAQANGAVTAASSRTRSSERFRSSSLGWASTRSSEDVERVCDPATAPPRWEAASTASGAAGFACQRLRPQPLDHPRARGRPDEAPARVTSKTAHVNPMASALCSGVKGVTSGGP